MIYSKKDMELIKEGLNLIICTNNLILDKIDNKDNRSKVINKTIDATNLLRRIAKDEEELPW